jgi:hypothetical protein
MNSPKAAKENSSRSAVMQFVLTGFTQDIGFRVFAFERMGVDRVRTKMTVRADLALIRRYGIQVQELPLLCRNLLERTDGEAGSDGAAEPHALIYSEDEMSLHAKGCAAAKAAAAQRKKPVRRPPSENIGAAWRGHHPLQTASAAASATPTLAAHAGIPDHGGDS